MRFTEILLTGVILTGLVWAIDVIFLRPKRLMNVLNNGKATKDVKEPILVEYCRAFFPILLIVLLLRSFLAEPFRIPSGSMRPTLVEGDFVLVNKFDYGLRWPIVGTHILDIGKPKRGEVIVFKNVKNGESIDMIKRVIGLPGDRIEYKENTIYVNGEPMKQVFVGETVDKDVGETSGWPVHHQLEALDAGKHDIFLHVRSPDPSAYRFNNIVVPQGSYFVMGDNRDNSDDSRFWGFVKESDILGRAMGIWMSWDSSKSLSELHHKIRWDRIGKGLNAT